MDLYLGGSLCTPKDCQLSKYNIATGKIAHKAAGKSLTDLKIPGNSQYWTQIGHKLYFIPYIGPEQAGKCKIYQFDLETQKLVVKPGLPRVIPNNVYSDACLASATIRGLGLLAVIGGYTGNLQASKSVELYEIESSTWKPGKLQMNFARAAAACVFHDDYLYAIG